MAPRLAIMPRQSASFWMTLMAASADQEFLPM
jgi:hypothetical protein